MRIGLQSVKQSPLQLTDGIYNELVKPSENNPITLYSEVEKDLFNKIVMKYMHPHNIMKNFFFGKLTLDALPHHWYTIGGTVFIMLMGIVIAIYPYKNQALGLALE